MTIGDEIQALLDGYGPPAPTMLPWLTRRVAAAGLPDVARVAAGQAALAAPRRWPAVTDAVAELLAGRTAEPDAHGLELARILPQLAAYLDRDGLAHLLRPGLRADAVYYAELAHPGRDSLERFRLAESWPLEEQWRPIMEAARIRPVPPLANLPLLKRLVTGPLDRPADLLGSEAAYLLPYLPAGPVRKEAAETALSQVDDFAEAETCWYAAATCARIGPYLDEEQRGRVSDAAYYAPPAWRPLLRELARRREPWLTPAAELAAAHPALAQLDELASRADPAELAAACAHVTSRIALRFGGLRVEQAEAAERPVRGAKGGRVLRPGDVPDWRYLSVPEPPGGGGPAGPPGGDDGSAREPERLRYLVGQCPDAVRVGETFSLIVRITKAAAAGAVAMNDFPLDTDVLLVAIPGPGLRLRSGHRVVRHVPGDRDSDPAMFELQADGPGPRQVDVTAWLGGMFLGQLTVEVTAGLDTRREGSGRTVSALIDAQPVEGAATLVVRYEKKANRYLFEYRDDQYDDEVEQELSYEPGPQVERLVAELDDLAKGRIAYSPRAMRNTLANTGMALWRELLPPALRDRFWERRGQIKRLTILTRSDTMPWELLYPRDPGRNEGFLVEQFPVTRAIFGPRPGRTLDLRTARFVVPAGSPPQAEAEIDAVRAILGLGKPGDDVLRALDPLTDLIQSGGFGLLHFACHNSFDSSAGSSISFDQGPFKPVDLTEAGIDRSLAPSAPVVFINACRTAGLAARYNQLDGWARGFLEAGAAAFIGSLWAVEDGKARTFATTLYAGLQEGKSLGEVLMGARQAAAGGDEDPTWLAYSVYGDPGARKADS